MAQRRSDLVHQTLMLRQRARSMFPAKLPLIQIVLTVRLFFPRPNVTSNAGSPVLAPSPLIGTFNAPRGAASPGPSTARPQSSRAQQNAGQTSNARQRPSSSTSNRLAQGNASKPSDAKSTPRDTSSVKNEVANGDGNRDYNGEAGVRAATAGVRRDEGDGRKAESAEAEPAKGRNSKTTTPVSAFAETTQSRSRPTRSTDPAPKRNPKKTAPAPAPIIPSDEESLHEGDDEDEEGEPRYCYCNEISFGEMVACDNDACPREWFHLSCVGMTKPPGKNGKFNPIHAYTKPVLHTILTIRSEMVL